ncbi:MAG: hypothetical protein BMS9Abin01_2276 [Gammaproteobacteria bacterium]|nr:MAG: hypothetical protein BMS9Abin01_2276 [Gammaproteobacteria bacterium]
MKNAKNAKAQSFYRLVVGDPNDYADSYPGDQSQTTYEASVMLQFLIAEDEYHSERRQSPRLAGFVLEAALRPCGPMPLLI